MNPGPNVKKLITNIKTAFTAKSGTGYGSITAYQNAEILIENGWIKEISSGPVSDRDGAEIVDAHNGCVLPGFIDAHTHPVFSHTREKEFIMRIQGKDYEEIAAAGGGIRNSARRFQSTPTVEIKSLTRERLKPFFEHGTTTIEAKSGYGLSARHEIEALEIIQELNDEQLLEMIPTFLGAHEIPDEYQSDRKAYIKLIINEMLPKIAELDLAKYCDVFCEKGVFSIGETRHILETAAKYGMKARIHADELHPFGAAELAAELGAATADHLVQVSQKGIRAMAEAGVIPVLLPATTFFLRKDTYAPARRMINAGCRVALATDFNPGSSMTQNMQMVWTIGALKLGMLPGELLWATTLIPAESLELSDNCGSLEPGKQADIQILDIPNLEYLAYHFGINHVTHTFKHGDIVFQKNKGN